jgi:alcohol dehydrogenase class IV
VAISNVRTGHIHEAGGALLELTNLSHAETLFVFFRSAIEQYRGSIEDREALLMAHLRLHPEFNNWTSLDDVMNWWDTLFEQVGLEARIRDALQSLKKSLPATRAHIHARVFADKVWINKECPLPLDELAITQFIDASLARFGVASRQSI